VAPSAGLQLTSRRLGREELLEARLVVGGGVGLGLGRPARYRSGRDFIIDRGEGV